MRGLSAVLAIAGVVDDQHACSLGAVAGSSHNRCAGQQQAGDGSAKRRRVDDADRPTHRADPQLLSPTGGCFPERSLWVAAWPPPVRGALLRVLAEGVTVAIDGNAEASVCTVDTAATVAWMLWLLAVLRSAGGQVARTGAGEASV